MDTSKIKKVGTREDVFKGLAERTAGGLKKDDINEKHFGNKSIYISKKLSDRMKANIATLRISNPNFFKRLQKKTMVSNNIENNNIQQNASLTPNSTTLANVNNTINANVNNTISANAKPNLHINTLHKNTLKKKIHPKTLKLAFKVKDNSVKTVFYPELQGINIKELKEELVREEAEEDLGITSQTASRQKSNEPFTIEAMPDIDINDLS